MVSQGVSIFLKQKELLTNKQCAANPGTLRYSEMKSLGPEGFLARLHSPSPTYLLATSWTINSQEQGI